MIRTANVFSLCLALVAMIWMPAAPSLAGSEPLTLRINDSAGIPGDIMAVVLRTYSPRGLTQGQICLGGGGSPLVGGEPPLESLVDFEVFSPQGDVTAEVTFDSTTGTTLLSFQSPSAGVNEVDGPMAVFYYRISPSTPPGSRFELAIDLAETSVVDEDSAPVTLDLRSGTLDIHTPSTPLEVSLEDSEGPLASFVDLPISTEQSLPLDNGLLVLTFDPSWVADDFPQGVELLIDPRYGSIDAELNTADPGRIEITFSSPDHSFNRLPGDILTLRLPISSTAEAGSLHPVSFDPSSFLVAANGQTLDLELENGVIQILPAQPLFSDGFESGDLSGWALP